MAVVQGSLKRDPVKVVWHGDKDVKVPDHLKCAGWVDADLCECSPGADVVTIRCLDDDIKHNYEDVHDKRGEGSARLYGLRHGVIALNGKTKGLSTWVTRLSTAHKTIAEWLLLRILAEDGKSIPAYYATCRLAHGLDGEPEEATPDGASKSDGAPQG